LILEVAGGQVVSVSDLYKEKQSPSRVALRPKAVAEVLGGDWKESEVRTLLQKLGFSVKASGKDWKVTAPSYRGDVSRDVDLIEEVARLSGLDRVPEKFPALSQPAPAGTDLSGERAVKRLLADLGFRETIHYSFVAPELASALGGEGGAMLANPLSREQSVLRPSLLPSLLAAASHHARHKMDTFRAFELRSVFEATGARPGEKKRLAGVLMGARLLSHWSGGVQATDFYDLKGAVERILAVFSPDQPPAFVRSAVSYLHPGQQASVMIEGRPVGILGEAHPDVLKRLELRKTVYAFDLDWDALAAVPAPAPRFADYPRTPGRRAGPGRRRRRRRRGRPDRRFHRQAGRGHLGRARLRFVSRRPGDGRQEEPGLLHPHGPGRPDADRRGSERGFPKSDQRSQKRISSGSAINIRRSHDEGRDHRERLYQDRVLEKGVQ
jgi:phenylalanyl-tRNA synthetase beta chain